MARYTVRAQTRWFRTVFLVIDRAGVERTIVCRTMMEATYACLARNAQHAGMQTAAIAIEDARWAPFRR